MPEMGLYHRINVWRIADRCPACGARRGYSQANSGGIEANCSDMEQCGFSEFIPTSVIHNQGSNIENARFEVLDSDNKIKPGWTYTLSEKVKEALKVKREEYVKEHLKMKRWEERQIRKSHRCNLTKSQCNEGVWGKCNFTGVSREIKRMRKCPDKLKIQKI